MTLSFRPHVQPYTLAFEPGGIRHWIYSSNYSRGLPYGNAPLYHVKTVCGTEQQATYYSTWDLYSWEQGWDVTCDECRAVDPVIERQQPIDHRLEAAYSAFKQSDDRGLSWRHSVRAAVLAAERYSR